MIIVHVELSVFPEKENDYLEAITQLASHSQEEAGNISYFFSKLVGQIDDYLITEVWASLEDFELHGQTPHFKAYQSLSAQMNFFKKPPKIMLFEGEIAQH